MLCFAIWLFLDEVTESLIYHALFFIDVLTTPLVFQVTYLFCNKTNLEILLKMNFVELKTWRIICCGHNFLNKIGNQRNS
ncbi:unnamed protein product [Caenorhabditis angaria]|uniref:Uncharacterized protein n=1 Tax=Caenorhabditis angaria TaxID=860376 RepID=A0A9P1IR04_9PELO|nr:unnamed protein product [Caenorhabditis angaria]